jgi:antibiotic biosynthesis monooxygenase (ABM) superfamily enzyme
MRGARATTVIVHHVPQEQTESFLDSEKEITRIAKTFPGYQTTELYPPSPPDHKDWVVLVHFDDQASLQHWLDSPARKACIEKLSKEAGRFELKLLPSGFGAWFTGQPTESENAPPPGWKMALTVLLALYPVVMILALTVGRATAPLGRAVSILIANALSICVLQWGVMPVVTRLLQPWLNANQPEERVRTIAGLIGILLVIGLMTIGFHCLTV